MHTTACCAKVIRSRGVSLIEVLVAVSLLSVGIVGTLGLQVAAKRANFEATQRATATGLAQDILERMRANPSELSTYTAAGAGLTLDGATMAAMDCSVDCTDNQLALFDLFEFEQELVGASEQLAGGVSGGLTTPTGCITGPAGGAGTYTVAIAWRGLTRLSNPAVHACGEGLGLYDHDGPGGTEADVYRRVLVVETYILDSF